MKHTFIFEDLSDLNEENDQKYFLLFPASNS